MSNRRICLLVSKKLKSISNLGRIILVLVLSYTIESVSAKSKTVTFIADTSRVLRNPLNGWVMYLGRSWNSNFWTEEGYDTMPIDTLGHSVRVSDYASTAYIRTSWASLEPEEGKYVWDNINSRLSKLFESVFEHHMKLAFRIVVDSRDQGQNTPLYVRDAGAKGFVDEAGHWSPYADDPVFHAKFAKFLKALAQKFDDPDKVDFIDAYGLGKWGEAHSVKYLDYKNKIKVFNWMTSEYAQTFTHIPLFINYHRLVGDTVSWAAPNLDSYSMLKNAIKKGYSLRHDAFGMTGYYQQWEKDFAKQWMFKRPIIMEGGWITGGQHHYWIDPSKRYRKSHSEDVRRGEYFGAKEAHVNMMDFRVGDETVSWFGKCFPLVKDFVKEGGYRLFPLSITFSTIASQTAPLMITSSWRNMGWGYCPTNIPQWNQKYKVGFALMDKNGNIAKKYVESKSDLSVWTGVRSFTYQSKINIEGLKPGKYTLLTAIVDQTKNNDPGIQIAVDIHLLYKGWTKISIIEIK